MPSILFLLYYIKKYITIYAKHIPLKIIIYDSYFCVRIFFKNVLHVKQYALVRTRAY